MFQKIKNWMVAAPVLALGAAGSAFAEVSPEVTASLADMKTDGLVVGGAVLVAIVAIAAFKLIRRAI